jgi:hypothetical protein
VYVCDRFVLQNSRKLVTAGDLSLDAQARVYIHDHLSYRFAKVDIVQ